MIDILLWHIAFSFFFLAICVGTIKWISQKEKNSCKIKHNDASSKADHLVSSLNLLNEAHIDENVPHMSNSTEDGQQVDEKISAINELSTPISLKQANRTEENGEKKKKKKKKGKTANLPEAGSELPDDYVEKKPEDPIEDPFSP